MRFAYWRPTDCGLRLARVCGVGDAGDAGFAGGRVISRSRAGSRTGNVGGEIAIVSWR